jgi:carboxylesterase type B
MRPIAHQASGFALLLLCQAITTQCLQPAYVHDPTCDVTYQGVCEHGIETFYSIHYGQDTSGTNRFKPPVPYVPTQGSKIDATNAGPACPQPKGDSFKPLYLSNVTDVSEDCLHLNVYRPEGTSPDAKLPVLLYIHGGSFWIGSKDELVIQPGGLIKRSVDIGIPMMSVTINYRLGGKLLQLIYPYPTDLEG